MQILKDAMGLSWFSRMSRGFGSSCLGRKPKSQNDMAAVTDSGSKSVFTAWLTCRVPNPGQSPRRITAPWPLGIQLELWTVSDKEITFWEKKSSLFSDRWTISVLNLISYCLLSCCIGSQWLLIEEETFCWRAHPDYKSWSTFPNNPPGEKWQPQLSEQFPLTACCRCSQGLVCSAVHRGPCKQNWSAVVWGAEQCPELYICPYSSIYLLPLPIVCCYFSQMVTFSFIMWNSLLYCLSQVTPILKIYTCGYMLVNSLHSSMPPAWLSKSHIATRDIFCSEGVYPGWTAQS